MTKLRPDLSGNPFLLVVEFNLTEMSSKKDWERKADKGAQINIVLGKVFVFKLFLDLF
ncbi:hypothetical protein SAMN04488097_1143 [Epilithonimonas lactis]|nr:hypothetical protein SAMN04488097_1143 [Epilithonimonas lactis]